MGPAPDQRRIWSVPVLTILLAVGALTVQSTVDAAVRDETPTLGQTWGTNQLGYGAPHPATIFNGGDPTGEVHHIDWRRWGSKRAVGWGTGFFVWPGFSVANGQPARARVVAFNLGSCGGRRAYESLVWFFPKYGQKFHRQTAIDACTGHRRSFSRSRDCRDVSVTPYVRAEEITSFNLKCRAARHLIASSYGAFRRYTYDGGRYRHGKYYCGTEGYGELSPPVLYRCARDLRSVSFAIR